MKGLHKLTVTALLMFFLFASSAYSMTIVTTFIGGDAPGNTAGRGNLLRIVQAASRIWESAYSDSVTIHLYVGWAPVGDAATHTLIDQGGLPSRELTGIILFDNSGTVSFYLDPTPDTNEEYGRKTEEFQDLGSGMMNVARVYTNPTGDAAGRTDLLTIALHEIGHALGMCVSNNAFIDQSRGGFLRLSNQLPFGGAVIPLASNNAGVTSHFSPIEIAYGPVMSGASANERRIPSALDIVANAQISAFTIQTLDPEAAAPNPGQRGSSARVAPIR